MSFTPSEKERAQAAAIAAVLDIVVDEIAMISTEIGFDHENEKIKKAFMRLHDNLSHRAKDYHDKAEVPVKSGDVKIVNREEKVDG